MKSLLGSEGALGVVLGSPLANCSSVVLEEQPAESAGCHRFFPWGGTWFLPWTHQPCLSLQERIGQLHV